MARSYKRDKNGRFSGTGGGGKIGKSAKNEEARAKYKKSKDNLASTNDVYGGNSPAASSKGAKKAIGAAKSGMTRTTKNLQGGASRQGSFKDLGKGKPAAAKKAAPKRESGAEMRDRLIRDYKPRQNNPKKGTKAYDKEMKQTEASRNALTKDFKRIDDKHRKRAQRAKK